MARTWLQIRVDLLGTGGSDLERPPGRVLIVGPGHTFEQLADAINQPMPITVLRNGAMVDIVATPAEFYVDT